MNDLKTNLHQSLPFSLKVVAVIFILVGISAAIEMLVSFMRSQINIDLKVLGIFVGLGLFGLNRGWRTCALFFTWFGLITVPIIGILFLSSSGPFELGIIGLKVGYASKGLGVAFAVILLVYTLWQYHVLTRSDVRSLFMAKVGEGDVALNG